jgi:hypothetical protein
MKSTMFTRINKLPYQLMVVAFILLFVVRPATTNAQSLTMNHESPASIASSCETSCSVHKSSPCPCNAVTPVVLSENQQAPEREQDNEPAPRPGLTYFIQPTVRPPKKLSNKHLDADILLRPPDLVILHSNIRQ